MVVRSVAVWSDEGMAERNETRIFSYTLGGGGGGIWQGDLEWLVMHPPRLQVPLNEL